VNAARRSKPGMGPEVGGGRAGGVAEKAARPEGVESKGRGCRRVNER